MNRSQISLWGMTIFGTIASIITLIIIITPNYQALSDQISSDLNLASADCKNLNDQERVHLQKTLLSAQKALSVENDYNKASVLLNSVEGDLHQCLPLLQLPLGGAELALLTMFLLMTAVGIRLLVSDFRKNRLK